MEGENKTNLELLLRRVAYANVRDLPTPGRRPVRHLHLLFFSSHSISTDDDLWSIGAAVHQPGVRLGPDVEDSAAGERHRRAGLAAAVGARRRPAGRPLRLRRPAQRRPPLPRRQRPGTRKNQTR